MSHGERSKVEAAVKRRADKVAVFSNSVTIPGEFDHIFGGKQDSKLSASFSAEPVIKTSKSGSVIRDLGWCVRVILKDGSIERLYGFASQQAAKAWIKDSSDQWLRGQSGMM